MLEVLRTKTGRVMAGATLSTLALTACGDSHPKTLGSFKPMDCKTAQTDKSVEVGLTQPLSEAATQALQQTATAACTQINLLVPQLIKGYQQHPGNGYGGLESDGKFEMSAGDNVDASAYFVIKNGHPDLTQFKSLTAASSDPTSEPTASATAVTYTAASNSYEVVGNNVAYTISSDSEALSYADQVETALGQLDGDFVVAISEASEYSQSN